MYVRPALDNLGIICYLIPKNDRLFQGGYVNRYATFQQYTVVPVDVVAKSWSRPLSWLAGD